MTIHAAWRDRWVDDDGTPALDDGTSTRLSIGWYAELRRLTDWIMGRRLPGATNNGWRENVGGLSLTRIATMKSLHQLHKAFAMRAKPDKPRGAPEKGESNAGVAQSILDAMEKMREQRVKQIASRIVEAALGVGIERERVWDDVKKKWRYPKRPRGLLYHVDEQGVAHGDPRFKTCHAVVIENLTNYRPEETRTRRENRQLMSWSSSKVKKYLSEGCQLYGLHLREVQANYTSQQDSRTGAPGMRCADVPVHEFMTARWWRKQINAAKKKRDEKKGGDARDRYLLDLDEHCGKVPQEKWKDQRALRIPNKGGEVFVSANPHSAVAKGLQADLNAAANIGLRALLDPDFLGKWWYMLCDSATGQPAKDKCAGAACLDFDKALLESQEPKEQKRPKKKSRSGEKTEKTNAWRDVGSAGEWRVHAAYWNDVKARVVARLRAANGLNVPYEAEPLAAADTRT
jgi:IS605 OrfB family transposase